MEPTLKMLMHHFPTFDRETVFDVCSSCDGDYTRSYHQLEALSAAEIRPAPFCEPGTSLILKKKDASFHAEVDVAFVHTGNPFSKYFPKSRRRMLIFLDDSGSMAGYFKILKAFSLNFYLLDQT